MLVLVQGSQIQRVRGCVDAGSLWLWCIPLLATTLVGCGRIGFDYLDQQVSDANNAIDATDATEIQGLSDESLMLPAGWTAEVWFDFSDSYTFVADDYNDDGFIFSNRPHHAFLLSAPFAPGIGLMGNQEVLELSNDGTFSRHDYFQVLPQGPDVIWDAQACGSLGTDTSSQGLCVAAGSQNAGDGIFRIESDWSMSVITTDNNVTVLAYDATGTFDSTGTPSLYWGSPNGLRLMGGALVYDMNMNGGFARLLDDGNILLSSTDSNAGVGLLLTIESGTHQETELARVAITPSTIGLQNDQRFAIIEGARSGFPGIAHVIIEGKRLAQINADGTMVIIAETDMNDDWIWVAGVSPDSGHPLADAGPGIFILEFNPTTNVDRVIRLAP